MRNQFHAQHSASDLARFCYRLRDLHAAALAASAGMDLRLHHHARRAGVEQPFRSGLGFFARQRHHPARHSHAKPLQDFFSLILMNLHK